MWNEKAFSIYPFEISCICICCVCRSTPDPAPNNLLRRESNLTSFKSHETSAVLAAAKVKITKNSQQNNANVSLDNREEKCS